LKTRLDPLSTNERKGLNIGFYTLADMAGKWPKHIFWCDKSRLDPTLHADTVIRLCTYWLNVGMENGDML